MDIEKYGCDFPPLCIYNRSNKIDTRLIFCLSAMLTRVRELWSLTTKVPMRTSKWHGWMLTYLSDKCFSGCKVNVRLTALNPYIKSHIRSIPNICKKIFYEEDNYIDEDYIYNPKHF